MVIKCMLVTLLRAIVIFVFFNGPMPRTNTVHATFAGTSHKPTAVMVYPTESFTLVTESDRVTADKPDEFYNEPNDNMYLEYSFDMDEYPLYSDIVVQDLLKRNETGHFLSTFPDLGQRYIVEQQLRYCPYVSLCGYSFNVAPANPNVISCCGKCDCNSDCIRYGTCCPDIISNFSIKRDDSIFIKNETSCTLMHLKKRDSDVFPEQKAALLYSNCPIGSDSELNNKCSREYADDIQTFKDVVPVTSKDSNMTFRNKYCAFCFNKMESDLVFWSPIFSCRSTLQAPMYFPSEHGFIREAILNEECDIAFFTDYIKPEECKIPVSICNETGLWGKHDPVLEIACSIYSSKYLHYHTVYRNVFCLLCNGRYPSSTECQGENPIAAPDFSFSGLLRFEGDQDKTMNNIDTCNGSYVWDDHARQCRAIYCSELRQLKNKSCVKLYDQVENVIYVFHMRLVPTKKVLITDAYTMAGQIVPWLNANLDKFPSMPRLCGAQVTYKSALIFNHSRDMGEIADSQLLYYEIRFQVYFSRRHDPDNVISFLRELKTLNLVLTKPNVSVGLISNNYEFMAQLRDDVQDLYNLLEIISSAESNSKYNTGIYNQPMLFADQARLSLSDTVDNLTVIPYFVINGNYEICRLPAMRVSLLSLRTCPMFNISKVEFPWDFTTNGIRFHAFNQAISSLEYSFANGKPDSIMLCTETYAKLVRVNTKSKSMSAETILSIICVSVSIGSLLVTLLTFSLLPALQTLPGKNTMALTTALLVAQVFYMVGSHGGFEQGSVRCKIVGIGMHFFLLLAMFWMNVCSCHTFKVFVKTRVMSADSGWKTYTLYHMYAMICSAIFVVINIVISVGYSDSNIGYGEIICYISSQRMREFTFGIPSAVVVMTNIGMFIIVVIKIKRMPSVPKHVTHQRNDIAIFAKLSTLTGCTWLFGFVYSWTGVTAFSYIFIVLSGGQGLLIMLSFVMNRRVLNMIRDSSKPSKYSEHTTKTAVVTVDTGDV